MIVHIINNPKQVSMTNAQVNQTLGEKHRIWGKHKSFGEKKRKKKKWGKKTLEKKVMTLCPCFKPDCDCNPHLSRS